MNRYMSRFTMVDDPDGPWISFDDHIIAVACLAALLIECRQWIMEKAENTDAEDWTPDDTLLKELDEAIKYATKKDQP